MASILSNTPLQSYFPFRWRHHSNSKFSGKKASLRRVDVLQHRTMCPAVIESCKILGLGSKGAARNAPKRTVGYWCHGTTVKNAEAHDAMVVSISHLFQNCDLIMMLLGTLKMLTGSWTFEQNLWGWTENYKHHI